MKSSLNRPRLIATAMAAVALPALAACNSSSSTPAATVTTSAAPSSAAASSAAAQPTTAASPAASSPAPTAAGGLTPPGAHLAIGQTATLGWVPAETDLKPGAHKGLMIQVTIKS